MIAEGLGTLEWFWNCANVSPKIFKMVLLLVFPLGTQECEKLPLAALAYSRSCPEIVQISKSPD